MSTNSPVAIIDIGSNSIKLLVAARGRDDSLVALTEATEETRIGTGITGTPPRVQPEAVERAIASVKDLLCIAQRFSPTQVCIVATSAVREAANRQDFAAAVDEATNHEVRILSGEEEAAVIGRGVRCDPALDQVDRFYLFDLGGGSLELLAFHDGQLTQLRSLPLGCVRLTERFVADPADSIPAATIDQIREHVRSTIAASGFRFDLPPPHAAVVTGGTATTLRAVQAAADGRNLEASSPELPRDIMLDWAKRFSGQSIQERRRMAGLPAARADIFPTALWTLFEVASLAGAETLHHSLCNLRFGLAADLLSGMK